VANERAWDDRLAKQMLTVRSCFTLVLAAAQHFHAVSTMTTARDRLPAGACDPVRNHIALLVCLMLLLMARSVVAQPSADELKRLTLQELMQIEVISISRMPATVWRTPAAVYVLTQDDIRRSGATSLPDVLRLVPGLQVSRIDSGAWAVAIRGLANQFSKAMLVLIDGRSVYTPLFAGVYWQVQDTVLEDIDRIEVIRGPGATVWGSNAVNGVINVITKSARDTTGTLVSALAGNVDHVVGAARVGTAIGNGAIRVYGKAFSRGPQYHARPPEYDAWREGQGGFRADWSRGTRDSFTVQGDGYHTPVGSQLRISSFDPPFQAIVNDDITFTGANLLARWKRQLAPASQVKVQVYWDHTGQSGPQLENVRDTVDVDFVHEVTVRRHQVVYGAAARISPERSTQVAATTNLDPANPTYQLYSAFAQDQIQVGKKLTVTVGSKFEHNSYTGLEVQPTVRILWNQNDRQSAWAAVTRAVRSPARLDRDVSLFLLARTTPPPIYLDVVGSSSFDSETLVGSEAGYRVLAGPQFALDLAVFHNRYSGLAGLGNFTPFAPVSGPPGVPRLVGTSAWTNAVDGPTYGFEVAPDWRPTAWWQLRGSYSYLQADLHTRPGLTNTSWEQVYEGSSPNHQLTVVSQLTLARGIEFDWTYRYVSELPTPRVPAFSTADIRMSWRATRALELSVVGQNLLDSSHPEFGTQPSGLVGIRRAVYGQVRWTR
jgi:iron complex outermembrane receptor protein